MPRIQVCFLLKRCFRLFNFMTPDQKPWRVFRLYEHIDHRQRFCIILDFLLPWPISSQENALKRADWSLDMENRAYYMTISIQRWLAIRLDFLGNILVFGIALFAIGFRHSVNPAKTGVVLSYTLSSQYFYIYRDICCWTVLAVTQVFCAHFLFALYPKLLLRKIAAELVSLFAQNEQNMNAVERLLHYTELPCEGETITPNDPPPSWPDQGRISFTDVKLAYRQGLPLVLKGITFDVRPGEKVFGMFSI